MRRKAFKGFCEGEPLKIYLQIQLSNNKKFMYGQSKVMAKPNRYL